MNPKSGSQVFDSLDAGLLMALFDAAHVPAACGQEQVLLGQALGRAQVPERTAKVGLKRNVLGRHRPDFLAMRLKRPRPNGLISFSKATFALLLA